MGKGDRKSKKGKIAKGTYGNRRPHKATKATTTSDKQSSEK
ncbi:30S ribosomal protein THX [Pontibacter sp. H259]